VKNIYLISTNINGEKLYKIGFTKNKVDKRVKQLKTGNPFEFKIESVFEAKEYGTLIETTLHKIYENQKIDGEWFNLNEEQINNFYETCEKYYKNFEFLNKNNTFVQDKNKFF
jgi:hypothetical protein